MKINFMRRFSLKFSFCVSSILGVKKSFYANLIRINSSICTRFQSHLGAPGILIANVNAA